MIYDARMEAELSQQALAELIGSNQQTISQLEDADYEGHGLLPNSWSMWYESLKRPGGGRRRLRMSTKRRKRHTPEQVVRKLRDADAMLNAGKDLSAVLQALEVSEATYCRWKNQYGGMKAEEAKRLKQLEDENRRLKELVAEKELDIKML